MSFSKAQNIQIIKTHPVSLPFGYPESLGSLWPVLEIFVYKRVGRNFRDKYPKTHISYQLQSEDTTASEAVLKQNHIIKARGERRAISK